MTHDTTPGTGPEQDAIERVRGHINAVLRQYEHDVRFTSSFAEYRDITETAVDRVLGGWPAAPPVAVTEAMVDAFARATHLSHPGWDRATEAYRAMHRGVIRQGLTAALGAGEPLTKGDEDTRTLAERIADSTLEARRAGK